MGDNQLRGDIETLAQAGLVDDVTTQWPLAWDSVSASLLGAALDVQPATVRAAATRVQQQANAGTADGLSAWVSLDAATSPSVVRGFDGLARGDGQGQATLAFNSGDTSARLSLGAFTDTFRGGDTRWMPDGSYIAQKIGDVRVYAGWLDHWWGPGWISALSLSNNARPMPQIGIERASTEASSWPVLEWLGPWQVEFFLGYLDGPRLQKHTDFNALRLSFNPAPGLQIGIARTEEFCGEGHPCSPLRDYFDLANDPQHVDKTNDEGLIDIKYSHDVAGIPAEVYLQLMNDDTSPFIHSGTTHLFGASLFLPAGQNLLRLTVEYTDSVATTDIFSFGDVLHGFAYNNGTYPDGMRYRDRTLGFSLDSDSRLLSLQGSWSDDEGRFYEVTLHHAAIGNPYAPGANIVSTAPVIANMLAARTSLPLGAFKLDLETRLADDQPRPHHGANGAVEVALRLPLL